MAGSTEVDEQDFASDEECNLVVSGMVVVAEL